MRAILLLAGLLAGCATTAVRPGGSYVAEGLHHVVTTRVVEGGSSEAAIDEELQSLRNAPGNLAVMLLRRDGELLLVAEWRSEEEARRSGGKLFDVLFEAAEFERLRGPAEEVPNSGSPSSRPSGPSSQNRRPEP